MGKEKGTVGGGGLVIGEGNGANDEKSCCLMEIMRDSSAGERKGWKRSKTVKRKKICWRRAGGKVGRKDGTEGKCNGIWLAAGPKKIKPGRVGINCGGGDFLGFGVGDATLKIESVWTELSR